MEGETLQDNMPYEFMRGEFNETKAYTLKDIKVIKIYDGRDDRWPGTHKNVYHWVVLENGYAVGLNENPGKGWSFLVIKMKNK